MYPPWNIIRWKTDVYLDDEYQVPIPPWAWLFKPEASYESWRFLDNLAFNTAKSGQIRRIMKLLLFSIVEHDGFQCSLIFPPHFFPYTQLRETQQFSTSIGAQRSAGYLYLLGNGERRDSIRLVFMFYLTVSRKRAWNLETHPSQIPRAKRLDFLS